MRNSDFPSDPVVKTVRHSAGGKASIPGQQTEFPNALWPKNNNKTKTKQNKERKRKREKLKSSEKLFPMLPLLSIVFKIII